jgi:hypothetical protein
MLWMDLWVHPYTVTAIEQVGVNFWNGVVWVTPNVLWCHERGYKDLQTASHIHINV